MRIDQHPCHSSVPKSTFFRNRAFNLYDCRVNQKPTTIGTVSVFFTTPWKASKFLHIQHPQQARFSTQQVSFDTLASSHHHLTIDPCGSCGFSRCLIIDPKSTILQVTAKISAEVHLVDAQVILYLENARKSLRQKDPVLAFETLRTLLTHLDCSSAEAHYLVGYCGLLLKDDNLVQEALTNLKELSPDWHEKLEQLKRTPFS